MTESRKRAVLFSESLDFPSIAAGGTAELAFSRGSHHGSARAGDAVALGSPAFLDVGLMAFAYVDANDDIIVRVHNTTGDAIDPSAGAQAAVAAVGALTIGEPVIDGDTLTVGVTVYRFKDTPAQAYDVEIGADPEVNAKLNIVAAINASGTEGVEYFAGTLIHPDVTATAFAGDDAVLTAKVAGLAGNSIALAETFTDAGNVIENDAVFLGDAVAGSDEILAEDSFWSGALII